MSLERIEKIASGKCPPMPDIDEQRAAALVAHLDCDPDDVSEARWGENTYDAEGGEYRVLTDEEADEAAHEYIRESVWAFNASFLECHTPEGIDAEAIESLRGDRCEDANAGLLALIEAGSGFEHFANDAIMSDGRGHFLAPYDFEEAEEKIGETYFYIYRTN